jgi:quinolinate synthase
MGEGADCESCAHCEWMAMNTLEKLLETLNNPQNEIKIDKNAVPLRAFCEKYHCPLPQ